MLREDDDVPADRVTAIFGVMIGVAFVGLLLFAGMNYRGNSKTTDPLSQVAESEKTWTAERTAPAVASAPVVPAPAAVTTPRVPAIASNARPAAPRTTSSANQSGYAVSTSAIQMDGAMDLGSMAQSTGFHLETAKLSISREPGGTYAVSGEIKLSNTSGGRVSDIKLQIAASVGSVPLDLGGQDTVIGSGSSRTFRVLARGVSADIVNDPAAYVEVEGVSAEGPYKDRIALR